MAREYEYRFLLKDHEAIHNMRLKLTHDNSTTTDVSWMTNLKVLNAGGSCGITQTGITGLNLVQLYAHDNSTITDVSWMTNLKVLNAGGYCGITQTGIVGLNSVKVYALNNSKISS
jgi:hypothetical protein